MKIKANKSIAIVFAMIVAFSAIAPVAQAFDITTVWNGGELVPCGKTDPNDCNWEKLIQLANNIVNFLVWISAFLVIFAFCYAGFLYITAFGEMSKIEQAHGIFKSAITGFFFVLCGWLIIATILRVLVMRDDANIGSMVPFDGVQKIQGQ